MTATSRAAGAEDAGELGHGRDRDPGRGTASSAASAASNVSSRERQLLDVADSRVDASRPRELDHPFRDVDGDDLSAELVSDALGEPRRARSRPRARRRAAASSDGLERRPRERPGHRRTDTRRAAPRSPASLAYSSRDDCRVVEPHGVRIGVPGIPRDGALPPSQAFTVAPTSANSPSCVAPFALRPPA